MDLRAKITDAICDQVSTSDTIDAVMGVVEAEQKHARADALFWAARHLRDTPITCTALTGPYWYGQGWKEAADHLQDLAGWDPSDGEAERTWLAARVRELEGRASAALELHQPYVVTDSPVDLCRTCDTIYPCATKVALEGKQ